jgi:HK97 gp10 family phage protein
MSVTVRTNIIPLVALIAALPGRSNQVVDDTAMEIRDLASQLAPRATGSLAASIYVSGPNSSDYGNRVAAASSLNPRAIIVPEVTPSQVLSLTGGSAGYTDVVGVGVEHGIFNELGTRYMAPQPFLFPAVQPAIGQFTLAMSHVAG